MSLLQRVTRLAKQHGPTIVREAQKYAKSRQGKTPQPEPVDPASYDRVADRPNSAPGDSVSYNPQADGEPDAGEVVWAWVSYEDDPSQGKDRPVPLVGKRGGQCMGLYLTSQDNTRDAADEARYGRYWMDVGTGGWDRKGRPSEVRLDRLILLDESAIRREGAALDQATFDAVIAQARRRGAL